MSRRTMIASVRMRTIRCGNEICGNICKSFEMCSASGGRHVAIIVGSGGGPKVSGIALIQLKIATTVSTMLNKGTKGVSAGWMISIRLMASIVTPPGKGSQNGSGIGSIEIHSGMGII